MAYHNLHSKNDRALVAYLISVGAGTPDNTFPGKRSLNRNGNCLIAMTEKSVEDPPFSATYALEVTIMARSMAAKDVGEEDEAARLASEAMVSAAFDAFNMNIDGSADKLADAITAAARAKAASDPDNNGDLADYTCLNVFAKGYESGVEGDAWVDMMNLQVIACPGSVSE